MYGEREGCPCVANFLQGARALTHFICIKSSRCNTINVVAGNRVNFSQFNQKELFPK